MHKKLLFIDDNPEITEPISKYLKLNNYDITVCNNAKNGMSLLLEEKFDTVLLDISMPQLSGFDIIDTLSKQGKIKDQKIIVLTAVNMSKEEIDGLLELGISCCLLKPMEMNALIETIESYQHLWLSGNSLTNKSKEIKELEQEKMVLQALNDYLSNTTITPHDFSNDFVDQCKNSITPVTAYVDMLIDGKFGYLNEEQKERLRRIKQSISELQNKISKNMT